MSSQDKGPLFSRDSRSLGDGADDAGSHSVGCPEDIATSQDSRHLNVMHAKRAYLSGRYLLDNAVATRPVEAHFTNMTSSNPASWHRCQHLTNLLYEYFDKTHSSFLFL